MTIQEVRQANRKWFDPSSVKFSGDLSYEVLSGEQSNKFYLVRQTKAFTDMFDQKPKLHYRVNHLDQDTYKIGSLTDDIFYTSEAMEAWIILN